MTRRPVIFFGNEQVAHGVKEVITPTLEGLIEAGYEVVAVFTSPDYKGRGGKMVAPQVKTVAIRHGIAVFQPTSTKELMGLVEEVFERLDEKPIGVLESYGYMIPGRILEMFEPWGIVNIHPSLLPKYRGATPVEAAILNGDGETGVSLMKLARKMDAGPVYAKKVLELAGNETKEELYRKLAVAGARLLVENLPSIVAGELEAMEQDEARATYCQKLDKTMSRLDVTEMSAEECYSQVRAFSGFPKSKLEIGGKSCVITEVSVAESASTEIDVKCADGRYLVIKRLVPEGGKEMAAGDFVNGYLRK